MNRTLLLACLLLGALQGCAQQPGSEKKRGNAAKVGGPCEGCEAIYECPDDFSLLNDTDTLPDFNDPGPKMLVQGIVYKADGRTPAPDVVVYVYHTNQEGIYPRRGNEKGWAERHGYIRGWIRTNEQGVYRFYTLKPGTYPQRNAPAHIHVTVKEPTLNEYYIDEYLFDDDPLLTAKERNSLPGRGGSGIVTFRKMDGILLAERHIILGKNIPGYEVAVKK